MQPGQAQNGRVRKRDKQVVVEHPHNAALKKVEDGV